MKPSSSDKTVSSALAAANKPLTAFPLILFLLRFCVAVVVLRCPVNVYEQFPA